MRELPGFVNDCDTTQADADDVRCCWDGWTKKKKKKKFQNELFSLLPLLHIWVSVMKHRRWRRRSRVNTHTRTSGGPFSPISAGWVERERTLKSRARSSGRSQRLFLELDVWWCSGRVFQERLETFFFFFLVLFTPSFPLSLSRLQNVQHFVLS